VVEVSWLVSGTGSGLATPMRTMPWGAPLRA
jgi:hypothetical protein